MIYMELAEAGIALAQLNAAILFDKYDIFDNSKTFLSELAYKLGDSTFNINKHLAYKYFKLASMSKTT